MSNFSPHVNRKGNKNRIHCDKIKRTESPPWQETVPRWGSITLGCESPTPGPQGDPQAPSLATFKAQQQQQSVPSPGCHPCCHLSCSPRMAEGEITTFTALTEKFDLPAGNYKKPKLLYCSNGGHFLRILPDGTVDGTRDRSDEHSETPPGDFIAWERGEMGKTGSGPGFV